MKLITNSQSGLFRCWWYVAWNYILYIVQMHIVCRLWRLWRLAKLCHLSWKLQIDFGHRFFLVSFPEMETGHFWTHHTFLLASVRSATPLWFVDRVSLVFFYLGRLADLSEQLSGALSFGLYYNSSWCWLTDTRYTTNIPLSVFFSTVV